MAEMKLTYFDFHGGRGEDCRLALHLAGADWEDDRVGRDRWTDLKPKTPYGSLPLLEVGGATVAQSNAILVYLGRRFGLHPSDPIEAARQEAVMCSVEDLRAKLVPTLGIEDEAEKKAVREELAEGYLKTWGERMEQQIGAGPYLGGDDLCVADLKLFVLMSWFAKGGVEHVPNDILSRHPKLGAHFTAVGAQEKVAEYYASRA